MPRRTSNRDALLEGAIRCIQERGYGRTTARDLVDASGTNLAAIGYHFGSKEALLTEALAECFRRWLEQVTQSAAHAATEGTGNRWEVIVAAAHRSLAEERPVALGYLEAWAQAQRSPRLRQQLAEHYHEIRSATIALVVGSKPDDAPSDVQTEALAAVLVAVADGLLVQWLLDPDALPDPTVLARILAPLLPE